MRHTLLLDIEGNDSNSVIFSVHRPKKFKIPSEKNDEIKVMELEFTGILMAYAHIVKFWADKNMINRETSAAMMAQFCMDNILKPKDELIELIPESMAEILQQKNPNAVMRILKNNM